MFLFDDTLSMTTGDILGFIFTFHILAVSCKSVLRGKETLQNEP